MQKVILITGSTDGIGLATAKMLIEQGHYVLLHGRNQEKLAETENSLVALGAAGHVEAYRADLSRMDQVASLINQVTKKHAKLDVLINNAGIFKTHDSSTEAGLDSRFVVNAIVPYFLTKKLLPILGSAGRVVNLSSAAQAPIDLEALAGNAQLDDMAAYAQSKLAITMWTHCMAQTLPDGPAIIAVNPGSLLASKMVKEGFGVAGSDINIGAEILVRASLSCEFATASGQYFDNDSGHFTAPHPDGLNPGKSAKVIHLIEEILAHISQ